MGLYGSFLRNQSRVCHKAKVYFPVYERYLARYCNTSVIMFEIGVRHGGSLRMWKEYLGPHAVIVGVDVNAQCKEVEEDQIHVRIGSQSNLQLLSEIVEEFGAPDIVLDDGSHVFGDQIATFDYLYPKTVRNGVYIVEDTETSYLARYGGGLGGSQSFVEAAKRKIDELHDRHWNDGNRGEFAQMTRGIAFFDSMVIFEKGFSSGRIEPLRSGRVMLSNESGSDVRAKRIAIRKQRVEARKRRDKIRHVQPQEPQENEA